MHVSMDKVTMWKDISYWNYRSAVRLSNQKSQAARWGNEALKAGLTTDFEP